MKRWGSREKGFTLIELLIVVGIIAVLGSVSVAALTGLIGTGTPEAKASEKAAVQTAVDAYMSVQKLTIITARGTAAVINSGAPDTIVVTVPPNLGFTIYIRSLPTKYTYSWAADGTVTQP